MLRKRRASEKTIPNLPLPVFYEELFSNKLDHTFYFKMVDEGIKGFVDIIGNLKTIEIKFQDDSGQMEEDFTFRWTGAGWVWQFGKITTPDIYSFLALFIDEQINEGGFKGD